MISCLFFCQALTRQNEEARRQLEAAAKPLESVGDTWKSEPQGGKKMSYEEEVPAPPPSNSRTDTTPVAYNFGLDFVSESARGFQSESIRWLQGGGQGAEA